MSEVYRNGRFEVDDWLIVDDDADLPGQGAPFISLSRWMAQRNDLLGRNGRLGVVIRAGDKVEDIADDLTRFAAIAVDFPQFTDGRGFSTARKLREEFGYEGEIHAIGDVLLDQVALMRRCGVDAFTVTNAPARARLQSGDLPDVTLYYQPVGLQSEIPAGTRPWARKPALSGCD